jgi:hypothetical protein
MKQRKKKFNFFKTFLKYVHKQTGINIFLMSQQPITPTLGTKERITGHSVWFHSLSQGINLNQTTTWLVINHDIRVTKCFTRAICSYHAKCLVLIAVKLGRR